MKALVSVVFAGLVAASAAPAAAAADLPEGYYGRGYYHDHHAVGSTYWRRGPVAEMRDNAVYVRVLRVRERTTIVHRRHHHRVHRGPVCNCKG